MQREVKADAKGAPLVFGNHANQLTLFVLFLGGCDCWNYGPWQVAWRCRCCGTGYMPANPGNTNHATEEQKKLWLCGFCGSPEEALVLWVGRATPNLGGNEFHWRRWEWQQEDRLPEDIRKKAHSTTTKPAEDEFEARVRAAVEVELALRGQQKSDSAKQPGMGD